MENIFFHVPFRDVIDNLLLLKTYRLNIEVYYATPVLESCTQSELEQLRNFFSENGLRLRVHAPVTDLIPGSIEARIREVSEMRYLQAVEICKKINASAMVLHSGFNPSLHAALIDTYIENASSLFARVARVAAAAHIEVFLENVFEDCPDFFAKIIEKVGRDNFKMCFDIGHQNAFGSGDFSRWIAVLRKWIGEIHLSDNDGESDAHLPPGKGEIPFDRLYQCLDESGLQPVITFEPNSLEDFRATIEYIKKHRYFS